MRTLAGLTVCVERRESEVAQSYPSLCDPIDCNQPSASIHVTSANSEGVLNEFAKISRLVLFKTDWTLH